MREKLTITNSNGDSVVLSHRPPFFLSVIDGLGDVDADVQMTRAPFQDGATHSDSLLEPRFIEIQVSILANSKNELSAMRQRLARVLNPKYTLFLLYENGYVKRNIQAHGEHVPKYPADVRGIRHQISLINLVCPNPYWQDVNPINIKLEDFVSNFRFPFHFPVRFASRGDSAVLVNKGDVSTPIKVTFRGEAINPKITNLETGDFIRVKRHIPHDYSLVINTAFGNKSVEIIAPDGVISNAMGYIDLDSEFFSIEPGENRFSFITEGGKPEVYVEYNNLYVGV